MVSGRIACWSFPVSVFILGVALSNGCQTKQGHVDDALDKPFLAHDAKTREYIGVVVMECRDWETKKVESYRIRLKDGRVVERSPDTITIDRP